MSKRIDSIHVYEIDDSDPDPSYLEQEGFEERLEEYRRGDFHFIGIAAKADLIVNGTFQAITTGGLWGIESDSDDSYIETIKADELDELKAQLKELGFTEEEIREAM